MDEMDTCSSCGHPVAVLTPYYNSKERIACLEAALKRIRLGAEDIVSSTGKGILSREELQGVARDALKET